MCTSPLAKAKDPDVSYIINVTQEIKNFMHEDQLFILESTTYPGTPKGKVSIKIMLKITKNDMMFILSYAVLLVIVSIAGWWFLREAALIITLVFSSTLLLFLALEIHRRLTGQLTTTNNNIIEKTNRDYQQIEALFSLFFTIKPNLPLPDARGAAASPDLLKRLVEVIFSKKPDCVVEASSGTATLIIAYCLKQIGKGKVISLEDNAKYAAITREVITFHGLEEIATIVHAPLKEYKINSGKWLWYDTDCLKIDKSIDLFVIDGPLGTTQKLARYPALPLLFNCLSDGSIIILDDAQRKDEREVVTLWEKEFSEITCEYLDLEKGAFILKKRIKPNSTHVHLTMPTK